MDHETPRLDSHRSSHTGRSTFVLSLLLAASVAALQPRVLLGQLVVTFRGWHEATVGSELESYLRILQLTGGSPLYPWSVRGFSPREVDSLAPRDSLHPWATQLHDASLDPREGLRLAFLRPEIRLIYNSAFPWAHHDAALWAGRGLTSVLRLGVQARYGPLSLTLDPVVFRAENDSFDLLANGLEGKRRFASGIEPTHIDLPQRFGNRPYSRIDPGQSSLRLDLLGVALGVSAANQVWGPALAQPLVLGNAGPGFPHAFIGSSVPVNVLVGRTHGRLVVGRLEQSEYSAVRADSGSRLVAGIVATFVPRWTPGLEVGLTRFFHRRWPAGGVRLADFLIPFQGFFLTPSQISREYDPADPNYTPLNQLASVFARWVFPRNGLEVFGEFARDDRNADLRDVLSEPDQQSAFALGFVKLLRHSARSYTVLRVEQASGRVTYIARLRVQPRFYTNTQLFQGHTNRGQALGSTAAALGGVGSTLALDIYRADGRWTLEGTRLALQEPGQPYGVPESGTDVAYAVRAERLLFQKGWEFTAAVTGVLELNRNFARDAFNLRLELGTRLMRRRSHVHEAEDRVLGAVGEGAAAGEDGR